jgi:hypothetical protein
VVDSLPRQLQLLEAAEVEVEQALLDLLVVLSSFRQLFTLLYQVAEQEDQEEFKVVRLLPLEEQEGIHMCMPYLILLGIVGPY